MARPLTNDNAFRIYDEAIYDWLEDLRFNYGTVNGVARDNFPVLRCFATGDHAFSAIYAKLVREGLIPPTVTKEDIRTYSIEKPGNVLPFLAISRGDEVPDPSRQAVPVDIRTIEFSADGTSAYKTKFPKPYTIPYTLEFYCLRNYTDIYFREWRIAQFGNDSVNGEGTEIPVDHRLPWGTLPIRVDFDGVTTNTELEGIDFHNRIRRMTVDLKVHAWIFDAIDADAVDMVGSLTTTFKHKQPEGRHVLFDNFPVITDNLLISKGTMHNNPCGYSCLPSTGTTVKTTEITKERSGTMRDHYPFSLEFSAVDDTLISEVFGASLNQDITPETGVVSLSGFIYVESAESDLRVQILDTSDNLLQEEIQSFTKRGWYSYEFFTPHYSAGLKLQFKGTAASTYHINGTRMIMRYFHMNTTNDSPITTLSLSGVVGTAQNTDCTSLISNQLYILSMNVLTISGKWSIILYSDAVSPANQVERIVEVDGNTNIGLVIMTEYTGTSLRFRVENTGIASGNIQLGDISLRRFNSPTFSGV